MFKRAYLFTFLFLVFFSGYANALNVNGGGGGGINGLGAWDFTKSLGTTYLAATDGIAMGYLTGCTAGSQDLIGNTDGSNPPTTAVVVEKQGFAASEYLSVTFPVKKNDYWRIRTNCTAGYTGTIVWIPLSGYEWTAPAFRGASATNSVNQTITTSTWTALNFDGEDYDTDTIHDNVTNNDRLTVPSGVSRIRLSCGAAYNVSNVGFRMIGIFKNGGTGVRMGTINVLGVSGFATRLSVTTAVIDVSPGDWFNCQTYQSSGGNLDTAPGLQGFAMEVIE